MIAPNPLPSADILRDLLRYEPIDGLLFWRRRDRAYFSTDHEWKRWNTRYAERAAFTFINGGGYHYGQVLGVLHMAHRVIWKIVTGDEPNEIDHGDGVRSNNRWGNLASVARVDNARNTKMSRRNKSGVIGVHRYQGRVWRAEIGRKEGMRHYLGQFDTFEEAVAARKAAERRLGYHLNHGRT